MNPVSQKPGWIGKFASAFRGLAVGVAGQTSFAVHIPMAVVVVAAMFWLRLEPIRCCVLLLCIAMVLACELMNTAIEKLAKSVTQDWDPYVRDALDIASGAVLLTAIFAVLIGATVLVPPMLALLQQ